MKLGRGMVKILEIEILILILDVMLKVKQCVEYLVGNQLEIDSLVFGGEKYLYFLMIKNVFNVDCELNR